MADLLYEVSLFPLVLTFGAYQIGLWCRRKWNSPLCNPLLIAVILVISFLLVSGISTEVYQDGMAKISWLLTPATVCLALPLYQQLKTLRKQLPAIFLGVTAGTLTSLASILDNAMLLSLLPKSITTAIGMVLSEQMGGIQSLTAAAIIATGILGSLIGSSLCRLLKLTDPIAQGAAFGTASHVIGTTRANEIGQLQGAVSSLSLISAGLLTAVVLPVLSLLL